ncbi:MAG: MinD/ParA family protein [Zymomonas mobilis subsp. pomaceae]|uniref:Cobyrinic acid ac-diamide synthase n=1 Tax=Zymomonas mobilis subsp. pomaceae (strain ATCC 29192 / DSM 22645 / JCM 10191 / CCUG 17912 / NBRC 13757 / NCIMB 11200 / NRRL B-4491 / Barker I) TaxID=579138 RepID=F8ERP4_ZYMMT|nr:MinD/ParA family protein [Zymomonas mobilis]AEI37502.1 Cobyrinic acid ac-diamide synthase [Zymomonas mobilis subsp. pomaceae ATCC 29192]MDX5948870.1 MinD/ParA family protein [Zymomonas mobilis subsp. pomaceae]GEB88677.1 site-determining protein [Zymomonas mobilis subsp. pomaceae]
MMPKLLRTPQVIAVASGKGGVGKTNVIANLTAALAKMKRRTLLLDCDLGMADVGIVLGMNADKTIEDILTGRHEYEDVVQQGPFGLMLVPGVNGAGRIMEMDAVAKRRLVDSLRPWTKSFDYILLDGPSGASPSSLALTASADRVILVISSEPTSFMDGYALIKLLALEYKVKEVSVVTNMVEDETEGRDLFRRFSDVSARFLGTKLYHLGSIPRDPHLREAVLRKRCCLELFPKSRAAEAFDRLAHALDDHSLPKGRRNSFFFGLETVSAS